MARSRHLALAPKTAAPLTRATLDACILMAVDPEALFDQKGRVWSRWATLVTGDYRTCCKCGSQISSGYVLQPELTVTLCATHVRSRWV